MEDLLVAHKYQKCKCLCSYNNMNLLLGEETFGIQGKNGQPLF